MSVKPKAQLGRELGVLEKAATSFVREAKLGSPSSRSRQTKASPHLIHRDFTSQHPNDLRLSDISYIPTREGWLYLAAILDAYPRALVGWAMRRTLGTPLAMDALTWRSRIEVNAPMDSFFHTLKTELVMHCDYKTRDGCARKFV